MKNTILGIVIILIGIIITITTLTITTTMNREIEIEDALQIAVMKCVENCTTRRGYELDNNDQFVADLLVELSNEIENDSDLKVDIMGVDKDKGYLSVRVTEYYTTVTGQKKSAVCETTAYMDKGDSEGVVSGVHITFRDNDGLFIGEQYVDVNKRIIAPLTPSKAGRRFNGWINSETNQNVGTDLGTATRDMTFEASYESQII